MFSPTQQTPLAEFSFENEVRAEFNGVKLLELSNLEHFNLRLEPDNSHLVNQLQDALGFQIPLEPNTFVIHENILCSWLGPDEWLIVAPLDQSNRVETVVRENLTDHFATLTKLGSAQTIIRVSGLHAIEFLSRGIAIDLDPSGFKPGQCVQTIMAHANVTVLNHSLEESIFDLIVRRSFADHLWRWLLDVGQEAEFRG